MTNGENFDGAIDSARQLVRLGKKVYHFYKGPSIPKDPREILELEKKVIEEEQLRLKAEAAKENIKRIWKERDTKMRAARRAKLKKLFRIKTLVSC